LIYGKKCEQEFVPKRFLDCNGWDWVIKKTGKTQINRGVNNNCGQLFSTSKRLNLFKIIVRKLRF